MWGLLFTYAWLSDIKTLLANEIEDALAEHEAEEDEDSLGELVLLLWLLTRTASHMGWLAQVGFIRNQARAQGVELTHIPSMGGVALSEVEEIARRELRVRDGKLTAPRAELADRLAYRLGTIVDERARELVRESTGVDSDKVRGSRKYAERFGEPDARLIAAIETGHGEVGRFVQRRPDVKEAFERLAKEYRDEFTETVSVEQPAGSIKTSNKGAGGTSEKSSGGAAAAGREKVEKPSGKASGNRSARARNDWWKEQLYANAQKFVNGDTAGSSDAIVRVLQERAEKVGSGRRDFAGIDAERAVKVLVEYDKKRDSKAVRERAAEEKKIRERERKAAQGVRDLEREMADEMAREDFEMVMELLADERAFAAKRAGRSADFSKFPIGWARIPTGSYTCGFCIMLASRGAVYRKNTVVTASKKKASKKVAKVAGHSVNAYHWGCDCIGVPVYKNEYRIEASTAGDMSGSGIDGEASVFAAWRIYDHFSKHGGMKLTAANFQKWINGDEGQKVAQQFMPDIKTSAEEYRRIRRRHARR